LGTNGEAQAACVVTINKYKLPAYKISVGTYFNLFPDFQDFKFKSINYTTYGYDLKVGFNVGRKQSKVRWLGPEIGIFTVNNGDAPLFPLNLKNAFRYGAFSEGLGPFNYSFDVVVLPAGGAFYLLMVKLPF
jgi:hypothetical protein